MRRDANNSRLSISEGNEAAIGILDNDPKWTEERGPRQGRITANTTVYTLYTCGVEHCYSTVSYRAWSSRVSPHSPPGTKGESERATKLMR